MFTRLAECIDCGRMAELNIEGFCEDCYYCDMEDYDNDPTPEDDYE